MPRDSEVYLEDILTAIDKIERFVAGRSREALQTDEMAFDAVVRNLEVIGEAVKHVPEDLRRRCPAIPWKKISGLRDVLIHAYFGVDPDIVWDVVANKLPELKQEIEHILRNPES